MLPPLYPLQFDPLFQYRVWGGRRLGPFFATALPDADPVGEAWVLSDRDENPSRVSGGALQGRTIAQLLQDRPAEMLGRMSEKVTRFPLLLKFLDVQERLSVQVHPADAEAKTEAWLVLEAGPASRVYAGLKPGITQEVLRARVADGTAAEQLASFAAVPGDGIFLRAGTVHSLQDAVVFEVQQNSDVTFRLFDWDKVDVKTGQRRALQVEQALGCIKFPQPRMAPVVPLTEASKPVKRERLFACDEFVVWRFTGAAPFRVGAAGVARMLVCVGGAGHVEHDGHSYPFQRGAVLLLPAVLGPCTCRIGPNATLLEISLADNP